MTLSSRRNRVEWDDKYHHTENDGTTNIITRRMTRLHGGKLKPVHSIDTGLSEGGMMAEVMGESVNGEARDKT